MKFTWNNAKSNQTWWVYPIITEFTLNIIKKVKVLVRSHYIFFSLGQIIIFIIIIKKEDRSDDTKESEEVSKRYKC